MPLILAQERQIFLAWRFQPQLYKRNPPTRIPKFLYISSPRRQTLSIKARILFASLNKVFMRFSGILSVNQLRCIHKSLLSPPTPFLARSLASFADAGSLVRFGGESNLKSPKVGGFRGLD